ncbi:hypothetical protein CONCODRAFT_20982, partial [Conidiobolus coronatus NRRL 28638]
MLVMSNIDNNAADDNKCSKLVKDKKKYRRCKNPRAIASLYCNLHLNLAIKSEKVVSEAKVDKEDPKEDSKESAKPQPLSQKYTYSSQCKFIKSIGKYKFRCRLIKLESSDYCKQHSTVQTPKKVTAETSSDKNTVRKDAKNERIKGKEKEKGSIHIINDGKSTDKKLEKVEVTVSSAEIKVLKQDKKVGKASSSVEKTKLKIVTSEVGSKPGSYKA